MSFKNILVGIADDDASTTALHGAAVLAQQVGANLHLVHASDDEAPEAAVLSVVRARVVQALEGTQLAGKLGGDALVAKHGEPAEVMLEEAKRVSADLLVVGPHRKHRFDFGSTAKSLMSHSHLSTLIQVGPPRDHGTFLVAVDLTSGSRETLRVAQGVARPMGARLALLHCYEGPAFAYDAGAGGSIAAPNYVVESERREESAAFEKFVSEFEWEGVEYESVFVEDDPARHILDRQNTVDLIIVGRHGPRGIFGSMGSLSRQLHKKIDSPLLIVPHE